MSSFDDALDAVVAAPSKPQPSAAINPLDAALDDTVAQTNRQALRFSAASVNGINPDQYAKAKRLAAETGVPAQVVDRNMPDVERRASFARFDRLLDDSPATARALMNPEVAKVAHDDTTNMGTVERVIGQVSALNPFAVDQAHAVARGVQGLRQMGPSVGLLGDSKALDSIDHVEQLVASGQAVTPNDDPLHVAGMTSDQRAAFRAEIGDSITVNAATLADAEGKKRAHPQAPIVQQVADAAKQGWLPMLKAFTSDPLNFIASVGTESMVANAPTMLAGGGLGMVGVGLAGRAAVAGAGSFLTDYTSTILSGMQDAGVDTSDPVAIQRASRDPVLMQKVGREAFAHAAVVGSVDAVSGHIAGSLPIPKAVAAKLATAPVAKELAGIAAQAPIQGALGAAGEAGGELAAGQKLDPFQIFAEFAGEFAGAPAEVASIGGHEQAQRVEAGRKAVAAEQAAIQVGTLTKAAADSKLKSRDPQAFSDFVKAAAAQGEVQDVFVDGKTFENALAQSGITTEQATAAMPDVIEQMHEAVTTGGDIRIPLEDLATHVAGTPLADALLPHLRVGDPDAMSLADAQVFYQDDHQAAQAEADSAEARATAENAATASPAVRDSILGQLAAVNRFTPAVNGHYATLLSSFYEATAGRMGITPEQLLEQYPVRIAAERMNLAPAFEQHEGTVLTGAQRTAHVTETPEFAKFFEGSKVVDAKGEPRVVYHATPNEFDSFKVGGDDASKSGQAIWLGTDAMNPQAAHNVLQGMRVGRFKDGVRTIPAYVSLKNPLVVDGESREAVRAKYGADFPQTITSEQRAQLQAEGHDGVMYHYGTGDNLTEVIALHPEQIKSAIGNRGTFDTSDPDFLHQGERGSYAPDTRTITLLKNADLSTFIHESGHFFLDSLTILAARDDAPASVKADVQTVLDWFGVKDVAAWQAMSLDQQRESHEMFARGFEAYAFEGEAPSLELQGIFQRFRSWLLAVYKHISALHVETSPEVRAVMGRLLASDAQIATAQAARQHAPLFASAEAAGMTPEDFHTYQSLGADATAQAVATVDRRSLRDLQWLSNAKGRKLKQIQREVEGKRKAMRAQVEAEVMAEPVNQAQHFFRTGETTSPEGEQIKVTEGHKLNSEAVAAMYPESMLGRPELAKLKGMTSRDGLDPEVAAQAFGFSSADHLIRSITDGEDAQAKIEGLTDQRMLETHGDITSRDALNRAAEAAIHNEARGRMLAREVGQLSIAVGNRPIILRAAREYAERALAGKKVTSIRPAMYAAAEARAGRNAEAAFKKGDIAGAAAAKREQLLSHELVRGAQRAQVEVEKAVAYLKKFDSPTVRSSIDPAYRDQIDGLLERYDLRTSVTAKEIARRKSLRAWVESQQALGFEPTIDPSLLEDAATKSYKDMTLEEVRGLVDAVKNIEHLGRLKTKLLTAKDQRNFGAVVDEMTSTIIANGGRTLPEARSSDRGLLVSAKRMWSGFTASHRKFASVAREFDGWKDGGSVWEHLVRNMNEAGDREAVMREQATTHLLGLMSALEPKRLKAKTFYESTGKSFTGEERIAIALNQGNEVNRERIVTGERLSPQAVGEIMADMTPAEAAFVNQVWAHLDSYRPLIGAKELRVSGVEPQWVQAQPFPLTLKTGEKVEMTGGYYPIAYDALRSERSGADLQSEIARQMQQGLYARSQTARGHTKERSESTGRPLRYDLNVIPEHISKVVHDLSWHEYLIDANRLLRAGQIENAVRDHYGIEPLQNMKSLMTDIAVGDNGPQSRVGQMLDHARHGTMVAGLGFNVANSLINLVGITQSVARIGPKWVAKGMIHWAGDAARLESAATKIFEQSDMMRLRSKTQQRELNEIRNTITGKSTRLEAAYFWLQTKTQLLVDIPTWYGAYEKAMAEADMPDEKRAVALADQAVLDAQGGGQTKDLAAVQRDDRLKLLTTFYSFFNTTYNLTAEATGRAALKDPASIMRLSLDMALLYGIPAVANTVIKGALSGDLDDWDRLKKHLTADFISQSGGTLVGFRELVAARQALAGAGNGSYSGPAAFRIFADLGRLASKAHRDYVEGEVDEGFLHALVDAGGILFHFPAAQVNRTWRGIEALHSGETSNPGVLLTGPKPKG